MNEWDEWKKRNIQKVKESIPKQKELVEEIIKRKITAIELQQIKALQKVSTACGTSDGRFISQFENATNEIEITDRQGWWINCLYYKYRRQLKDENAKKPIGYGL